MALRFWLAGGNPLAGGDSLAGKNSPCHCFKPSAGSAILAGWQQSAGCQEFAPSLP